MHSDEADLELLNSAAKDAGALAMSFFRNSPNAWSKSGGSPVTEADMAVDAFLRDDDCSPSARTMAGCRRRRPTIRRGSSAIRSSSSIRSTARAASSRATTAGASASPWCARAGRSSRRSTRRRADEFYRGDVGRRGVDRGDAARRLRPVRDRWSPDRRPARVAEDRGDPGRSAPICSRISRRSPTG